MHVLIQSDPFVSSCSCKFHFPSFLVYKSLCSCFLRNKTTRFEMLYYLLLPPDDEEEVEDDEEDEDEDDEPEL